MQRILTNSIDRDADCEDHHQNDLRTPRGLAISIGTSALCSWAEGRWVHRICRRRLRPRRVAAVREAGLMAWRLPRHACEPSQWRYLGDLGSFLLA